MSLLVRLQNSLLVFNFIVFRAVIMLLHIYVLLLLLCVTWVKTFGILIHIIIVTILSLFSLNQLSLSTTSNSYKLLQIKFCLLQIKFCLLRIKFCFHSDMEQEINQI